MILTIKRVALRPHGTFGVLLDTNGRPFALTAERPDLGNVPGVSCIPDGTYTCHRIISPHFGETFEVINVPHRSHILLHKGNIPEKASEGCILIGEQFGLLGMSTAVLSSKHGYNEFMAITKSVDTFVLKIVSV